MDIHNVTEDSVLDTVNEIFDEIERTHKADNPCTCYQCRLDTACYVLNRSTPQYVVSSRGVARVEEDSIEHQQEGADLVALVYEGIHRVARTKRPHFEHSNKREGPAGVEGPVFNFPTIVGRLFNGQNFEPLNGIDVTLLLDGVVSTMIDPNWQNPYLLVPNTAGAFSFRPLPIKANSLGEEKRFSLCIRASAPGLEDLNHHFEFSLTSERDATASYSKQRTHHIGDLYLFPPEVEQDD